MLRPHSVQFHVQAASLIAEYHDVAEFAASSM